MSEAELIFTALAELSTRQIADSIAATGMNENESAAKTGGGIARKARLELESKTGGKVVSAENYLPTSKKRLGKNNRATVKPTILNMALSKYPSAAWDVAAALTNRYRDFNHHNLKNPLDELLFIICSKWTGEAGYRDTYRSPKQTLPTHLQVAEAPAEYIARPMVSGGLSNQKAKAIRELLDIIV